MNYSRGMPKKRLPQLPTWLACSLVVSLAVGLCVGLALGVLAVVRFPALQWVVALLLAIGLGWVALYFLRKYLREWRVRLFGRNSYATVRSVTIGAGGGENKEPDHAMVSIDGYQQQVDIILHGWVSVGDRIRVRYHPRDPRDATHFTSWSGYLVGAVIGEVFLLAIILTLGGSAVGIVIFLLRALGIGR
jgi:hypothetical protein